MYKSLNDYDVVNGIFSLTMGQRKENRKALQYEASGHYFDAYELYNKVFLICIPISLFYSENVSIPWILLDFLLRVSGEDDKKTKCLNLLFLLSVL